MLRRLSRAFVVLVFCISFAGVLATGLSLPRSSSSSGGTSNLEGRKHRHAKMGNVATFLHGDPRRRRRSSLGGYEMIEDGNESRQHHTTTSISELSMTARGGGGGEDEQWVDDAGRDQDKDKLRGRLILLLVAFLYGTLNVVLRLLYGQPGPPTPAMLSATRGWLAAACFLPAIPQIRSEAMKVSSEERVTDSEEKKRASLLMVAVELAVWNFLTQGLVNVGLLFTEAARASFFTQTSVVITPLISVIQGNRVGRNVWIGCASALAGLVLLSTAGGDAASSTSEGVAAGLWGLAFSGGDLLVLGGAVCWSIYIVRTSSIGDRYPEVSLQAVKTVALAMMYTTWLAFSAWRCFNTGGWDAVAELWLGWNNIAAWGLLAYSAIGPGALADVLQQNGQKEISASEANVILCSEPIFTAFLAFFIAGETTTMTENAGGALVVLAAILASSGSGDDEG